jgi:hypothetical protein
MFTFSRCFADAVLSSEYLTAGIVAGDAFSAARLEDLGTTEAVFASNMISVSHNSAYRVKINSTSRYLGEEWYHMSRIWRVVCSI